MNLWLKVLIWDRYGQSNDKLEMSGKKKPQSQKSIKVPPPHNELTSEKSLKKETKSSVYMHGCISKPPVKQRICS